MDTGNFGRILHIVNVEDKCYFNISSIIPYKDHPFEGVSHILRVEYENEEISSFVHIDSIKEKVLLINTRSSRYLCTLPNTVEVQ